MILNVLIFLAESTKQQNIPHFAVALHRQDRIPASLAFLAGPVAVTTETTRVGWAMVLVFRLARALAPLHCAAQAAGWET